MSKNDARIVVGRYVVVRGEVFRDHCPRRAILRRIVGDEHGRVRVKPIGERETTVYLCDLERVGKR